MKVKREGRKGELLCLWLFFRSLSLGFDANYQEMGSGPTYNLTSWNQDSHTWIDVIFIGNNDTVAN